MPKRRRPSLHASPDAPAPSRPQRANSPQERSQHKEADQAVAGNSALAIVAGAACGALAILASAALGFAGHTTAAVAVASVGAGGSSITITVNVRRR